jgi:diadenosine tetraphosphatase ApaH/serine/threonine PP2A family protein phosphatase
MPRIALISDIHGNIDALEAVLADIETQAVDEIACLGDVVGYGAAPAECIRLIHEKCPVTVIGNHDTYLTHGLDNFVLSKRIGDPLRLAERSASKDDLKWLRSLPFVAELHGVTLVHASLHHPESFNYLNTDLVTLFHLEEQVTPFSFCGHTHRPALATLRGESVQWGLVHEGEHLLDRFGKSVINVGAVGQPRDDDPRAAYGIVDTEEYSFELRRVPYDIDMAVQRIREASLPEENALRLLKGE